MCAAADALDLSMAPAGSGSSSSSSTRSGTENGSRISAKALVATPEKWLYKACTGGTQNQSLIRSSGKPEVTLCRRVVKERQFTGPPCPSSSVPDMNSVRLISAVHRHRRFSNQVIPDDQVPQSFCAEVCPRLQVSPGLLARDFGLTDSDGSLTEHAPRFWTHSSKAPNQVIPDNRTIRDFGLTASKHPTK